MTSLPETNQTQKEKEAYEFLLNTFSQSLRLKIDSVKRGESLLDKELIEDITAVLLSMAAILRSQIPNWDSSIINILTDDLIDLSRGGNPKYFCKPHSPESKGVLKIETNEHYALLHVAIMLFKNAGLSTKEAENLVARRARLKLTTVAQLHKDFSRSQKSPEAMKTVDHYRNFFSNYPDKRKAADKLIEFYQSVRR